jgi:hypothetical protein
MKWIQSLPVNRLKSFNIKINSFFLLFINVLPFVNKVGY